MKWLLRIGGVLVLLVLIVAIVGWALPVAHVATASATVAKPPEALYAVVSDIGSYGRWWPDDPKVKTEVVEARPPSRFVSRIADPDQPFGGTWTIEIAPEGSGSRITVTERGEVYNPILRFLSRFVIGHTATLESFLGAIQSA